MGAAPTKRWLMGEQDRRISVAIQRDLAKLRSFIRSRVSDSGDAEDILQDVFYELVEAYRVMKPIEQVSAWLFRVARNRITDRFRRRRFEGENDRVAFSEDAESLHLADLLPSPDAGPEAAYARSVLLDELDAALDELPAEQRDVFVAHEFDGISFKE